MARASGASTVVSERNKGKKCEEEADLISDLPDCLIQHILSFLPTTKDAIRTGILSKRWLYQWTHIPNLIFYCNNGMSIENFPSSIDDALNLYNCSKINKFLIDSKDLCSDELREKLTWWIDFAAVRDVKELILDLNFAAYNEFELPQSLFKNEFLVKLKAHSCYLPQSEEKVNWSSLKALYIDFAYLPNDAIENVLSGSPVIECLELGGCYGFERLFVASESLKTFRLSELDDCNAVEISCANLEKLELLGQMSFTSFKLKDLPPSVCATLDFEIEDWYYGDELNSVREFLLQVQHIEDLEFGSSLLKVLSVFAKEGVWSLLLNSKSLTVINPFLVATQPGIAFLLISCPLLERLVIQLYGGETFQIRGFEEIGKDFWESDASAFDCPVSHLKTVEIVGLYYISSNGAHNDVLKIFTFLLKNAIMLEKMVFLEDCGHGMVFAHEVCKKLACVQKASLNAIIKAECLSVVGTSGASSTISEGNEGKNKRMKCEEEDDFISALPDCLIQHILSFLPSTKDAIRTGILSKRWLYQWTCVPNLILYCNDGMSIENFPSFVDDALNLYNCSKINKFVINSNGFCSDDLREKLARWINFAVARDVKILILDSNFAPYKEYVLPQFLFKNEFLAKLKVNSCYLSPSAEKVNWSSLKALCIDFAYLPNNAIENVLSGSPVIEDLELCSCYGFERLVIASKSLKTFCLSELDGCNSLEISCANLEKLELLGQMSFTCCKLKDLPPSVSATFDFEIEDSDWDDDDDDDDDYDELEWVKEFLLQVQYIEDLKLGYWLVMVLSVIAVKREFSLLLNSKSFTMIDPFLVETQPGIAFLLISCSVLEKLVIQLHGGESFRIRGSVEEIENDFWESDERAFDCPVSHLRTVEIVGLYYISSNGVHKDALKIFTFLLKNAIMLEKMVFLEDCEQGMVFADDVCKKLKCVQKASSNAIVKAECLLMVDLDSDSDWDKIVC